MFICVNKSPMCITNLHWSMLVQTGSVYGFCFCKWSLVVIIFANEGTLEDILVAEQGHNFISLKQGISSCQDVISCDGDFNSHFNFTHPLFGCELLHWLRKTPVCELTLWTDVFHGFRLSSRAPVYYWHSSVIFFKRIFWIPCMWLGFFFAIRSVILFTITENNNG